MQIEKKHLRKIRRIFEEISVPIRLYSKDGSPVFPEDDTMPLPDDAKPVSGQDQQSETLLYRYLDVQPPLYVALPSSTPSGGDLLRMAEGMLASILGSGLSVTSQSDIYRMILKQELTGDELLKRAAQHHIPTEGDRAVMLMSMTGAKNGIRAYSLLNDLLPLNDRDVLVEMDSTTIALLRSMRGVDGMDELKQYAQAVQETLLVEAMQSVTISIGDVKHSLSLLGESYAEAKQAMEIGLRFEPQESIFLYRRLILDRFLSALPREECQRYHAMLFNRRTVKLFNEEMLQTIDMFFRKDLNLSDTARQLFIHRNTLVYRLDKVQRLTGLDLRRFDDAVTFKILYKLKRCTNDKTPS